METTIQDVCNHAEKLGFSVLEYKDCYFQGKQIIYGKVDDNDQITKIIVYKDSDHVVVNGGDTSSINLRSQFVRIKRLELKPIVSYTLKIYLN